MPGMLLRMHRFASEVSSGMPFAHFLVSADDTGLAPEHQAQLDLPPSSVHRYVWDDVKEQYRVLRVLPGKFNQKVSARYFHMEPILLAVAFAEKHTDLANDALVWVFEDDVFICGTLSGFVSQYAEDASDFLGYGRYKGSWVFWYWGSGPFLRRYAKVNRTVELEHVQRFSMRFVRHMASLCREQNFTAESEMFAPTVCQSEGFRCSSFDRRHLGVYMWNTRLNQTAAGASCARTNSSGLSTINHAGKF
ncbi:unnamed protein product [Prorocentrum cordatum]|uniref:Hexosyltransferase n=1 Tax=Prorocentrum cordatum TaxID=2364126 RepID=A0ABN9PAG1_9DINO|nr:unnamed protein product [Polarella glacialis]